MKRIYVAFLTILTIAIFLHCGKDPVTKGDEAFQQRQYGEAVLNYEEALKAQPENDAIRKKLAIANFKLGEQLFKARHVIRAYEGRIKEGLKYAPKTPDAEFKRALSDAYLGVALAYKQTPPKNPTQREMFFQKTLEYLEKAQQADPTNTAAQEAYQQFVEENFENMLNKGIAAYKKGKKDPGQYLIAEYYLEKALQFKPDHPQAKKYLRLARKGGLDVLDMSKKYPIAITSQKRIKDWYAIFVVVRNNTPQDITVSPENFVLLAADESEYTGTTRPEFKPPFSRITLKPAQEAEGVVVFPVKGKPRFVRLELWLNDELASAKNFP